MAETAGTISGDINIRLDKLEASINLAVNKIEGMTNSFRKNLTKAESNSGKAFSAIADQIKRVNNEMGVFGRTTDKLREKQKLIGAQIRDLLSKGISPQSSGIKNLKAEYDRLGREIDSTRESIKKQRQEKSGLDKLQTQAKRTSKEFQVFGRSTELLRKQKQILLLQIRQLLAQGLSPQSVKIQTLKLQYDSLTREINENTAAARKSGNVFTKLGDNIRQFVTGIGIFLAVFAAIKKGISIFADFEQSIKNVQAVTKATGKEFLLLQNSALKAGETTRFSASQAADALFYLSSAGLTARESVDALDGALLLAGATGSGLAETADTVTAVMSQFSLQASDSSRIANVFAAANQNSQATMEKLRYSMQQVGPVAAGLGLSLEETVGALQILYNAGFQGETAGRALKSALADLASPSQSLTKVFTRLGIAVDEVNPKNKSFSEIIGRIRESGADTADIIDAFGKVAGPQLSVLIKQGEDAINDYTRAVTATNAAAESYAIQNDSLQGSIDSLKSIAESAAITIVNEFSPGLRDLIEVVKTLIQAGTPLIQLIGFIFNNLLKIVSVPIQGFFSVMKEGFQILAGNDFDIRLSRVDTQLKNINETIGKARGLESQAAKIKTLTNEYENLSKKTNRTKEESDRYSQVVQELGELVPEAVTATDDYNKVLEINSQKSRQAAEQILRSKEALLAEAKARLELEKPILNNIIRTKKAEADRVKANRASLSEQARIAEERLAIISRFEAEIDKRAGEDGDLVPIVNRLLPGFEKDFKRLGIVIPKINEQWGGVAKTFLAIGDIADEDQKTLEKLRNELGKEQKVTLEVEEAQKKLDELEKTEKQLLFVTGQLSQLEVAPVKQEAKNDIDDLQRIANAFWADFNSNLEKAVKQDSLLGDEMDVLRSKMNFISGAVKDLTDKGFTEQGFTIQKLVEIYKTLSGEVFNLTEKQKEQKKAQEDYEKDTEKAIELSNQYASKLKELNATDEELLESERQRALESLNGFVGSEEAAKSAALAINDYFDALADEKKAEEAKKIQEELFEDITSGVQSLVSNVSALFSQLTENRLAELDRQLQAELEAKGLAEESEIERLEKELQAAKDSGDEEAIQEKEKALEKAKIIEQYEQKKRDVEYESAIARWGLNLSGTIAEGARALAAAYASGPFPFNIPAIGFATAGAALTTGTVLAQKPEKFQTGGIVPGNSSAIDSVPSLLTPGEAVLTGSDQRALFDLLRGRGGNDGGQGLPAVLKFYTDNRLIAEVVTDLINNGEYSIDATRGLINADKLG